jgi:hypothetical protein
MKEYLDKIKNYSTILCKSAKWHNSGKAIGGLSIGTANACDYIYEFFCYLVIIEDLEVNYDLEYYSGTGGKQNLFPKAPSEKNGHPFFYLIEKGGTKKLVQICAGTKIESKLSEKRAPDISFQKPSACLVDPKFTDVLMIYDAKRKRPSSSSKSIGESQYSYFAIMVKELELEKAASQTLCFTKFKLFNGNCLITNAKARRGKENDNTFHHLKEVENFDDKLDLGRINVIG